MTDPDDSDVEAAEQLCEPLPVPPEAWTPVTPFSVPAKAVRWYGDEIVRTILSWYWGQVHESPFPPIWVSQFHLYLDFSMTGELGAYTPGRMETRAVYSLR